MKFDITQEPWIPVRTAQGDHRTLNLLEFLEQSPDLRSLDGLNPMEEYSVYRFFSTFLLAALKPETWMDKFELIEQGKFDMDCIQDYIQMCRNEGVTFDLFDEKRPFMQCPYNPKYDLDKNLKSPAVLDSTRASGNNPIHFDHNLEDDVIISPAQAFIGILTSQLFCTAMSGGYPSNVYGAPPIFFLPYGNNLYETLVLSTPLIKPGEENVKSNGKEFWLNSREVIPKEDIAKTSKFYGMLFPARRILLTEEKGVVKKIYYQPGLHYTGFSSWSDPHVVYRLNKEKVPVSIKPSIEREGWRHLGTLAVQFAETEDGIPEVLLDYERILEEQDQTQMNIITFAAVTNNASYLDTQRGMLKLDVRIASSIEKSLWVSNAIRYADDIGSILRKNLRLMIAPPKNNRGLDDVQREIHRFFSLCEEHFYHMTGDVAQLTVSKDILDKGQEWRGIVLNEARQSFEAMQNIYCSTAEELIRAEEAWKWFNIEIAKLKEGK